MGIKKSKNILFVISQPDVFKSPTSDTYIIFGEAKIEDLNALQMQRNLGNIQSQHNQKSVAETNEEEDVDAAGLDANDIQMVIDQASVTRAQAIKALKAHDGDIVNAIMELTM